MVDFRYHVVSIIAVFLALALGIVVGTTALNGALLDNLKTSIDTLSTDKRALEGSVSVLREQVASDQRLVEQVAPAAAQGQLDGQRVVLVTAPDAPAAARDQLVTLLRDAGATVSGEVRLHAELLTPAQAPAVADALAAAGVRPDGASDGAAEGARTRALQLLAAAVLQPRGASSESGDPDQVLRALVDRDLIDADPEVARDADLAVLVAGEALPGTDPEDVTQRTRSLVRLAAALDEAGAGVVVAAPLPATTEAGPLQALRDDGAARQVSGVDGVEQPQGRLAVVYALREQAAGGVGQYGLGPGTQGPLPDLPPP